MENARPQDIAYTYLIQCWLRHQEEAKEQKKTEEKK